MWLSAFWGFCARGLAVARDALVHAIGDEGTDAWILRAVRGSWKRTGAFDRRARKYATWVAGGGVSRLTVTLVCREFCALGCPGAGRG